MNTYSKEELIEIGFSEIGKNVSVHKSTQFYKISGVIGDNSRLDGPSIYTGNIIIGSNVHIGAFCRLAATNSTIKIGSFSGISSHCAIYAVSEDFSSHTGFGNPTLDSFYQNTVNKEIVIGEYVMCGVGVTLLPGTRLEDKCVISSALVIRRNIPADTLVFTDSVKLKFLKRKFLK